jgi:protein SCO1/2
MHVRYVGRVAAILVVAWALGCERGPELFDAKGVVTGVEPAARQLSVDHEAIPGLMPAMTMNFDVADPALLEGLAPGQHIRFRISFDDGVYRIVAIEKEAAGGATGSAGAGTAAPGATGSAGASGSFEPVADEGQPAPAFELVDQDGRPRSLESLRGRVLLLDFVYANCPGPCPILTGAHVRAQKVLPDDVRDRVWFVSITLDPERDTPDALRSYGAKRGADLSRWSFLTGPRAQVEEVVRRYGVGSVRLANGEIQHVVVSFLIDPQGRVVKRYFGLEHHGDDLAKDLADLARRTG